MGMLRRRANGREVDEINGTEIQHGQINTLEDVYKVHASASGMSGATKLIVVAQGPPTSCDAGGFADAVGRGNALPYWSRPQCSGQRAAEGGVGGAGRAPQVAEHRHEHSHGSSRFTTTVTVNALLTALQHLRPMRVDGVCGVANR
ncbi:hypothetical protein LTR53_007053 [Teratosphaeriaceae sp. CCFEE 6253]|nr:hypothetical protein LTR53_007053 [Teratosphaeriaceae sp. CCFEE 6253]